MILDDTQPTGGDATTTVVADTIANAHTLVSPTPTSTTKATITINHQQLRDVLLCLHERGVVNYIQDDLIVRHDLRSGSDSVPLLQLPFPAFSFAGLSLPGTGHTLYAAGGHFGQIHLSMHPPYPSDSTPPDPSSSTDPSTQEGPEPLWSFTDEIPGSMNNHLILTQLIPGSEDPRVVVCNNDCFLKVFDVPVRAMGSPRIITRGEFGILKAEWPINQCSLSPDGRTLLTVGDSKHITLHSITSTGPSSSIHFQPITTLSLLPHPLPHHTLPFNYDYDYPPALFSSAFSRDGRKFAVSSQGGEVMVWDVRMCASGVPVKVVLTDRSRRARGGGGGGGGYDAWGARSLKFGGREGREVLVFNEHTSLTHIIDARTFDTEEIITVPSFGTTPSDASFATTTPSPGAHDESGDLAGICFDPSGEYLYTGSTTSVAEWQLL